MKNTNLNLIWAFTSKFDKTKLELQIRKTKTTQMKEIQMNKEIKFT
jgi:hypothetical protein